MVTMQSELVNVTQLPGHTEVTKQHECKNGVGGVWGGEGDSSLADQWQRKGRGLRTRLGGYIGVKWQNFIVHSDGRQS